MKKLLRAFQTFFPFLHNLRFTLKFALIRLTKTPHEKDFNALKKFRPAPDDVFVDIGANRGETITSMLIFRKFSNRVVGFEPNPLVYKGLKQRFARNQRVTLYNSGLGDKSDQIRLYIPFYRKWMFDGLASFKYEVAADWLKTRLWRFNENKLTVKPVICNIHRLDDYNLKPYFIKIDVQGYELEVLKGSYQIMKAYRPILLIEAMNRNIMDFLQEFGYKSYTYNHGKFTEGRGALNTFCMTPGRYREITNTEASYRNRS